MQSCLLDLYDPDRAREVTFEGGASDWGEFVSATQAELDGQKKTGGAGLRILTETITSPTLAEQLRKMLELYPAAKWHQYEPANRDNELEGSKIAFGEFVAAQHHFDRAEVVLSLGSDFLYTHPQRLRYARHFTDARRVAAGNSGMNRLYVIESCYTITGAMAEHRLAIEAGEIRGLARAVLEAAQGNEAKGPYAKWVSVLARDLKGHRGSGLVIAGEEQPPEVHELAHRLNEALGNVGKTVDYTTRAEANPVNQIESLRELARDMEKGKVEMLVMIGGNPVFTAPSDFQFGQGLGKVKQSVHLSLERNETSAACRWHIPKTHFLESWSDLRSYDGTVTIMQPLIAPLFGGKSEHEVLEALIQPGSDRGSHDITREYWGKQNLWKDFESGWRKALNDGFVEGSALPRKTFNLRKQRRDSTSVEANGGKPGLEVAFRLDPNLWDGRFANNAWLLEIPKPLTKLTWDNAVVISPELAKRGGFREGEIVEVSFGAARKAGPIQIMPGQAAETVLLHLGWGRKECGEVGKGRGVDFYALRRSDAVWGGKGVKLTRTGKHYVLTSMQKHQNIPAEERQVYREGTLEEFLRDPNFVKGEVRTVEANETLYEPEEHRYPGRKWGMSIDLTTCIGCNACVMACNIENNIPTVGKEQVEMGREMLWLRIDTYFAGTTARPKIKFQPVPCMQCENAPCEYVCPVEATLHDSEGLNLQVYNRCIGTRYCSNNCPYKVRRFNFLQYSGKSPLESLRNNPEVSVRTRGVMEKCTYCVQRIRRGSIRAEEKNRGIRDGEIKTACQEACPTQAIIFGDLNTPKSAVQRYKAHPLDFSMLGELNTRPRTTYAAELKNPNPEMKEAEGELPA
jgi:molybdopterin-containing oxidoreductase family iron-sulfur binding subunit